MDFHFPGFFIGSLFIFGIGLAFFVFSLVTYHEEDSRLYQQLIESEDPNHLNDASPYKAKQQRQAIQKDIFFTQKEERLQLRLISAEAELILDHHDDETEIIEQMHDVKCYMQEELFYVLPDGRKTQAADAEGVKAMQIIRYLEAEAASYHYKSEKFKAENVKISRYAVQGHQLEDFNQAAKLIMDGLAKKVEFSLSGKDLNFKAHQLKAKFDPSEKIF